MIEYNGRYVESGCSSDWINFGEGKDDVEVAVSMNSSRFLPYGSLTEAEALLMGLQLTYHSWDKTVGPSYLATTAEEHAWCFSLVCLPSR